MSPGAGRRQRVAARWLVVAGALPPRAARFDAFCQQPNTATGFLTSELRNAGMRLSRVLVVDAVELAELRLHVRQNRSESALLARVNVRGNHINTHALQGR